MLRIFRSSLIQRLRKNDGRQLRRNAYAKLRKSERIRRKRSGFIGLRCKLVNLQKRSGSARRKRNEHGRQKKKGVTKLRKWYSLKMPKSQCAESRNKNRLPSLIDNQSLFLQL